MKSSTACPDAEEFTGIPTLSGLMHSLNQPLTALVCVLEIALTGERTVEDYRRLMREARTQVDRAARISSHLRDYAELSASIGCRRGVACDDNSARLLGSANCTTGPSLCTQTGIDRKQ